MKLEQSIPRYYHSPDSKSFICRMHGQRDVNWQAMMGRLNDQLALDLDPKTLEVLSLLMTVHHQNLRYASELHIANEGRSSNATHSICAGLEMDYLICDAMGVRPGDYPALPPEINQKRQQAFVKMLLHDMGEMWGELITNGQQSEGVQFSKQEKDALEERIFQKALRDAVAAVYAQNPVAAKAAFLDEQRQIAERIDMENNGLQAIPVICNILDAERSFPQLKGDARQMYDKIHTAFSQVEAQQDFWDALVKHMEKIEGTAWIFMQDSVSENTPKDVLVKAHQTGDKLKYPNYPLRCDNSRHVRMMLGEGSCKNMQGMVEKVTTDMQKQIAQKAVDYGYDMLISATDQLPPIVDFRQEPKKSSDDPVQYLANRYQDRQDNVARKRAIGLSRDIQARFGDAGGHDGLFTALELKTMFVAAKRLGVVVEKGYSLPTMIDRGLPEDSAGLHSVTSAEGLSKQRFLQECQRTYDDIRNGVIAPPSKFLFKGRMPTMSQADLDQHIQM